MRLAKASQPKDHGIMSSAVSGRPVAGQPTLSHDGLLYRTSAEYLGGVLAFIHAGLAAAQPTLVAVPGPNLALLRDGLDGAEALVTLTNMTAVGRNPARIIPAIRRFVDAHPVDRVRFVGEPLWPGRSEPEICESTRHEAMLNTEFADTPIDILCPYDVSRLDPAVIADAWRTHPTVIVDAEREASPQFTDPPGLYAGDAPLLPNPPNDVPVMLVQADDLTAVRQFVERFALEMGLGARRTQDLVLAVNEIATNTILHTPGSGTLRIWSQPQTVICEIRDTGYIADAFAGRRPPSDAADHGRGLWMANQLCDLVQIRSSAKGTTIRLHVDRPTG
jgi:anti-sigma regulatory factor (Ser/Thr protein kinase)